MKKVHVSTIPGLNTRCRHKITFGSYILSDYYRYCVCKKCKEKFEVKQKKFDWLKLLIPLMFVGNILATRIDDKIKNPNLLFAVQVVPIIAVLIILITVTYRRYRIFCQSVGQMDHVEETSDEGNG